MKQTAHKGKPHFTQCRKLMPMIKVNSQPYKIVKVKKCLFFTAIQKLANARCRLLRVIFQAFRVRVEIIIMQNTLGNYNLEMYCSYVSFVVKIVMSARSKTTQKKAKLKIKATGL